MSAASRPRLLTIAGSDSGGGAGIQADLKTFAAHGGYGMSVITAVTAQNTVAVTAAHAIPAAVVAAQIDAVFSDLGVDAVKIGMLATAELIETVAAGLERWGAGRAGAAAAAPPVVLDPVMVAKSGDPLLADDAVATLVRRLLPLATVVTPNLPEARRLAAAAAESRLDGDRRGLAGGVADDDLDDSEPAREALARRLAAALPAAGAVLLKGGHAAGDEVVDLLLAGGELHRFAHPRQATRATHGTGCTLSSAIAARLGRGEPLPVAVGGAIAYLQGAIAHAVPVGAGHGPVNHAWTDATRDGAAAGAGAPAR